VWVSESKANTCMFRFFTEFKQNLDNKVLELELDSYNVEKYSDFYDILFIDSSGFIFHSIRKESDYHTNILMEECERVIDKKLRHSSTDDFIEYEYYLPSDELTSPQSLYQQQR